MNSRKTEVLIIGAGPTGLMLAAQLLRFGIDCRIIEKNPHSSEKTKAIAVQARSLEIYDQMDLADEALQQGLKFTKARMIGKVLVSTVIPLGDFGKGLSPFPFVFSFTQDKNESLLIDHLRKKYNKEVEWNTEFKGYKEVQEGVETTVKFPDGSEQTIHVRYLVGADGGRSPVRHCAAISFEGETYEELFFVADTAIEWKYGYGELFLAFGKNKLAAFFPIKGEQRFRIVSIVPEKLLNNSEITFDDIKDILKNDLGISARFFDTSWFAEYRTHHRVVNSFSKGRIFLAGDAAHIHSPAGGQGMNTGLQDAYNLAWKLAAVIKHHAGEKLLNTYNEERLPNAIRLVKTTDRAFSLIVKANPFLRANIMPLIANIVIRIPSARKNAFKTVSQIAISYDKNSLSEGVTSRMKAGERLPYVNLKLNGKEVSIYQLLKAPVFHVLICTMKKPGDDKIKSLNADLENILKGFVKCILIDDAQKHAFDTWGITSDSLIIVRPDNYTGCIINGLNAEKAKLWFNDKIVSP